MQVSVSPELGVILDDATALSVRLGKYFVGVEHLFEALVVNGGGYPKTYPEERDEVLREAVRRVQGAVWQGVPPSVSGEIFYTPRCAGLLSEAGRLARQMNAEAATLGHLLLAILSDTQSLPSRVLESMSVREGVLEDVLSKLRGHQTAARTEKVEVAETKGGPAEVSDRGEVESFTRDLTALAESGQFDAVLGRKTEMMNILEILARKGKHNVILAGAAGVGKTRVVEGLAAACVRGKFDEILGRKRILELNLAALMSGTQLRGAFEDKVQSLVRELESRDDTILFIDEIHLMMGAGATDGDGMDLANLLKPLLGRGELRVIGATTLQEYRKFIQRDPAIDRRFQLVRIEALSPAVTEDVLGAMRDSLERHHRVRVSNAAITSAVELTVRYLPNRQLPDKAVDALDQACARTRIRRAVGQSRKTSGSNSAPTITPHEVRKVVSQMAGVPLDDIASEARARLTHLDKHLNNRVVGQDAAVERVASAVKKSRAGLADPNRPDSVMLFLGPTGVGKTQLAKELATAVFGARDHLLSFDMSEYVEAHSVSRLIGAPPGYAGCDEDGALVAAVKDMPYSVVLFDEIEKAHPKVFDVLLPLLEEGRLRDANGQSADFRNTTIIFTSNVGAGALSEPGAHATSEVMESLREHFRPEFINRIDEIVPFYPLLFEDVRAILKQQIDGLRWRLRDKKVGIRMYQGAYERLAELGYNPEFGARELRRVVEREIAGPLSERLLENEYAAGDMVEILMEDGEMTFRKGAPSSKVVAA